MLQEGFVIPACLRLEKCSTYNTFPLCETLYKYLYSIVRNSEYPDVLTETISNVFHTLKKLVTQTDANPLAIADGFAFYSLLLRCSQTALNDFTNKLSFKVFEQLLLAGNLCLSLLDYSSPKRWVSGYKYLLRAILATYGVRIMPGLLCFSGLPIYSHVLVSRSCQIFKDLQANSMFCVDIEGFLFLVPLQPVLQAIRRKIVKILSNITDNRKSLYQKQAPNLCFQFKAEHKLVDEENQAYTAACVYGELHILKHSSNSFLTIISLLVNKAKMN